MSQALAQSEERGVIEGRLWQKVSEACRSAKIPLDAQAPDFVVAAVIQPPAIGVYRINDDVAEEAPDPGQVFDPPEQPEKKPRRKKAAAKEVDK